MITVTPQTRVMAEEVGTLPAMAEEEVLILAEMINTKQEVARLRLKPASLKGVEVEEGVQTLTNLKAETSMVLVNL